MTRGKNAATATNRERVIAEREAPLRRRIAQLEAQVEKLDRANLQQQADHNAATIQMRNLIAANTSERLQEAGYNIIALTEERDLALSTVDAIQTNWQRAASKMMDELRAANGGDHAAAVQTFMEWIGDDPDAPLYVMDGEEQAARKYGAAGVMAMRRARRGIKSGPLRGEPQ